MEVSIFAVLGSLTIIFFILSPGYGEALPCAEDLFSKFFFGAIIALLAVFVQLGSCVVSPTADIPTVVETVDLNFFTVFEYVKFILQGSDECLTTEGDNEIANLMK